MNNKIIKILLPILSFSLGIVSCGNPSPSSEPVSSEITIPEIEYTIDEALMEGKTANDDIFSVANVTMKENSPLKGKTIYWLGSSVTFGSASQEESMADYLQAMTGCISKKDAISGTTIFDDNKSNATGRDSYTRRLVNSTIYDKEEHVDAFICQISTNDARNDRLTKRGYITHTSMLDKEDFDLATTLGGIEFIIAYVAETWGCPVYFYSGSYFGDTGDRKSTNPTGTNYAQLVDEVKQVADKWNEYSDTRVKVIDLYNDEEFNAQASSKYYKWATSDAIHPKRAGYLQWWTPYFENFLIKDLILQIEE